MEDKIKEPIKTSYVSGLSIVIYIVATLIGSFIAEIAASYIDNGQHLHLTLSSGVIAVIACPVMYRLMRDGNLWSFRKCSWKTVAGYAALGWMLMYATDAAMQYTFIVFDLLQHESVKALYEMSAHGMGGNLIIQILGIAVAPAILEEMFFRGVIFKVLRVKRGFIFSAALSSLIFGILHGTALYAVLTFLSGMMLCMILEITQSIVVPVVIHFCNNFLALIQVRAAGDDTAGTGVYGFESMTMNAAMLVLTLTISIAIFALLIRKAIHSGK